MSEKTLKPEVVQLSAAIMEKLSIDKTSGDGKVPEDIYKETLPEGLTLDIVKQVAKHDHHFTAAAVDAFAKTSTKTLLDNKKLDRTQLEVPFGYKQNMTVSMDRESEVFNPSTSTKDKVFGRIKVDVKSYVGSNKGEMATVRALAKEAAATALKK